VTRTLLIKNKTQRVSASLDGRQRVLDVRDPADFDSDRHDLAADSNTTTPIPKQKFSGLTGLPKGRFFVLCNLKWSTPEPSPLMDANAHE
jgi:hypothetical protein